VDEHFQVQEQTDIIGKTVMHYVVKGTDIGTYDNIDMFNYLQERGFNPDLPDHEGKRPIHYINNFKNSKIYNKLKKLKIQEEDKKVETKKNGTPGKTSKGKGKQIKTHTKDEDEEMVRLDEAPDFENDYETYL